MSQTSELTPILPLFRLDGRTALVTGAGAGIGAAIAAALAEAGADVVLVSLHRSELESVAQQIRDAGGRVLLRECDVTNTSAVKSLISELPSLDIVVNNAGTNIPEPFVEVSEKNLDFLSNLNVRASFIVSQTAVCKMLEDPARGEKGGVVINITSRWVTSARRTGPCIA